MHPFVISIMDIKNGKFLGNYLINGQYRQLNDNDVKELATVLSTPENGETVTYNLSYNQFTALGVSHLCQALTSRSFSSPIVMDLSHNKLNDAALHPIAQALQSNHFPAFVTLRLGYNQFSAAGIKMIANALASGHCPPSLTLDFEGNIALGTAAANHWSQSLKSKSWPAQLTLNLKNTGVADAGMEQLAKALPDAPHQFALNVSFNGLTSKSIITLTEALPHAPEKLTLNLSSNSLKDEGIRHLATALKSMKSPLEQTLILDFNGLTDAGVQHVTSALSEARPEQHLSISLAGNNLTSHSLTAFGAVFKQKSCPQLTLSLKNNQLSRHAVNTLASLVSRSMRRDMHINLAKNKLKDDDMKALWLALASEHCPPYLTLQLNENLLNGNSLNALLKIAEALPHGLTLNLSNNLFNKGEKQQFVQKLKNKLLPLACRIQLSEDVGDDEQVRIDQLFKESFHQALAFLTLLQGNGQTNPLRRLPAELIEMIFEETVPHEDPARVARLYHLATRQLARIHAKRQQKTPAPGFFQSDPSSLEKKESPGGQSLQFT